MTKISELGLCKNECCADKIRAAMKAGTAYGRATPTLSAAMELPEVKALVDAIQDAIDANQTELNLGNYDHDDVCKLQNEAIDIWQILTAAIAQLKEPKP